MENYQEKNSVRDIASTVRAATTALTDVVRSEVRLAKAEVRESTGKAGKQALSVAFFGVMGLLGVPPFIAFLVIGLGVILGGSYWLSALIVSAFLFATGGSLAYLQFKKLKESEFLFPETRETLGQEAEVFQNTVHRISDIRSRRSSS